MNMNSSQDWEPVVLRKSKPKAGTVNKDKVVNEALRTGGQVIV
jgi:putative transcription factor